jgi:Protein of unknown function (DUF2637)
MSDQIAARPAPGAAPGALRIIGISAVGVGLAALAGAAFVLSYPGIHAFARQAGISARLARGYPLIFDVLLVVILAAVLALRGAGLPSRVLGWACLLALLAAAAGADAMHAAGRRLPAHSAAVIAAIVPWVLVLIAFSLLLAMLRHARLRRAAGGGGPAAVPAGIPVAAVITTTAPAGARARAASPESPFGTTTAGANGQARFWPPAELPPRPTGPLVPGLSAADTTAADPAGPDEPGPEDTESPAAAAPPPSAETDSPADAELAIDAQLLPPDDPSRDETPPDPEITRARSAGADDQPASDDPGGPAADGPAGDPAADGPAGDPAADGSADPEMPVFHRMWSSPTPPGEDD